MYCRSNGEVFACCDKVLLGKCLKDSKIEINVSSSFYGSEETDEAGVRAGLKEHRNINLVGEKAVGIAIDEGLISESGVIRIGGVPHAVIIRL
jgi:hypothetical protein